MECIPEAFVEHPCPVQTLPPKSVVPESQQGLKEAALTIVLKVAFQVPFYIYSTIQIATRFYLRRHLDQALNSKHEERRHQVSYMRKDYVDKGYIDQNLMNLTLT